DWGRKETDKLAFEQIGQYLAAHGGHGHGSSAGHGNGANGNGESRTAEEKRKADDRAYFEHKLVGGAREGFLWQKLREPRSYDFRKTETKGYNEWLRMPQFHLSEDDIESVMTFVLGLVSEPPSAQYVYGGNSHAVAIAEGMRVLEKFNCGGCHVLKHEKLTIRYTPSGGGQRGDFPPPQPYEGFEFLREKITPEQAEASKREDLAGMSRATIYGLAALARDQPVEYIHPLGDPQLYEPDPSDTEPVTLVREFLLWKNALIDGHVHYIGTKPIGFNDSQVESRQPPLGGSAARAMMPRVFEEMKPLKNDLTGDNTWALVPPPLLNQGSKLRSDWLHDFLLNPYPIRPAVQLRMPKFNMSPQEASKLVDYFEAVENREQQSSTNSSAGSMSASGSMRAGDLQNALKLVATVCSQCHKIGDFTPSGHPVAMAPNLDDVHTRMRPDYLKQWIARPPGKLPYTNMPVNFGHNELKFQQIYPGTSSEQVSAIVEILMNYDAYMKNQVSVAEIVPPPAETPPAAANPDAAKTDAAKTNTKGTETLFQSERLP
ncbi:MAG: hypothetical protein WD176_07585, partial [Pirellulales bacterium]